MAIWLQCSKPSPDCRHNGEIWICRWALALLFPPEAKFPLLERLDIAAEPSGRGVVDPPISFLDAPKLRRIATAHIYEDILLPWYQLTTLQSESDLLSCLKGLRNAPNLVDVNFEMWDAAPLPSSNPIIPRLNLQRLTLGGTRVLQIIDCLQTPALNSLDMYMDFGRQPALLPSFPSFVSRSSFKLHSLTLAYSPVNSEALSACLRATPSVARLKLRPRGVVNINGIFINLTRNPDFLPPSRLESLEMYCTNPSTAVQDITGSLVVEMLG
ncbi:hypothetical protein C8R43DRAFT_1176258 [Mycena crocata]|nr:hypothetical protein C8R43DRAFT_1176258 [Mycena crocata]